MNIVFLKGKTPKGIIVGESNLREVIKKYGKNKRKIYFKDYSICYEGICFHFEAKELNDFLIKHWEYQQLKVLSISIFPKTDCP